MSVSVSVFVFVFGFGGFFLILVSPTARPSLFLDPDYNLACLSPTLVPVASSPLVPCERLQPSPRSCDISSQTHHASAPDTFIPSTIIPTIIPAIIPVRSKVPKDGTKREEKEREGKKNQPCTCCSPYSIVPLIACPTAWSKITTKPPCDDPRACHHHLETMKPLRVPADLSLDLRVSHLHPPPPSLAPSTRIETTLHPHPHLHLPRLRQPSSRPLLSPTLHSG